MLPAIVSFVPLDCGAVACTWHDLQPLIVGSTVIACAVLTIVALRNR